MEYDCGFTNDNKRFRYRAAAIIVEDRCVLFAGTANIEIIKKYGLPQDWNPDGKYGPERYVEAHVWSDRGILKR